MVRSLVRAKAFRYSIQIIKVMPCWATRRKAMDFEYLMAEGEVIPSANFAYLRREDQVIGLNDLATTTKFLAAVRIHGNFVDLFDLK